MPMVQGYWSFKPLANGMVEVTMSGHADPGGRIPATAVNFLIQEHPYNTLKGLRKIIGEPSQTACFVEVLTHSRLVFFTEISVFYQYKATENS